MSEITQDLLAVENALRAMAKAHGGNVGAECESLAEILRGVAADVKAEGVSGPEQGAAGGPTTEQVATALGAVWNEICADNGCFPDCINVEQTPELTLYADFRRGEFARLVAETLRAALRSASPGATP